VTLIENEINYSSPLSSYNLNNFKPPIFFQQTGKQIFSGSYGHSRPTDFLDGRPSSPSESLGTNTLNPYSRHMAIARYLFIMNAVMATRLGTKLAATAPAICTSTRDQSVISALFKPPLPRFNLLLVQVHALTETQYFSCSFMYSGPINDNSPSETVRRKKRLKAVKLSSNKRFIRIQLPFFQQVSSNAFQMSNGKVIGSMWMTLVCCFPAHVSDTTILSNTAAAEKKDHEQMGKCKVVWLHSIQSMSNTRKKNNN
jgi:hypothetical protein